MQMFNILKEYLTRVKCKKCNLPKTGILDSVLDLEGNSVVSVRYQTKEEAGICTCQEIEED